MVTDEGTVTGQKVTGVLTTAGHTGWCGSGEWQRELQFTGESGHFSRLEHLGLDLVL